MACFQAQLLVYFPAQVCFFFSISLSSDMVTSVDFHPTEDNYFLTGCMDSKLRIWNILEGKVMRWIQAPSVITSASFCPGGMFPVAFVFDGLGRLCSIGLVDGQVIFYYTDGLRYFTQVCYLLVILTHRLNVVIIMAKIVKDEKCALLLISVTVLAIRFLFLRMTVVWDWLVCLVITIGFYSIRHGQLQFAPQIQRPHQQKQTTSCNLEVHPLRVFSTSNSNDYKHIISPSEDGYVYIWRTADDLQKKTFTGNSTDRSESYEYFKAVEDNESLTGAIFAPNKVFLIVLFFLMS